LNTVHSLVSGDKIYDAQTLFVALLLNVIKIFCLDLSPGCVCFETFDYLRVPHQRAFDPPIARTLTPGINIDRCVSHALMHLLTTSQEF
jgi:hypothetical protein